MRREGPSITFTVYFDGQFWVGTVERVEEGGLSAARVVFGAEPSEEEILKFILERWDTLRFSPEVEAERRREPGNPKRRQREAAKAAARYERLAARMTGKLCRMCRRCYVPHCDECEVKRIKKREGWRA